MQRIFLRKKSIIINALPLLSKLTGVGRYLYEVSKNIENYNINFKNYYYYGYFSTKLINNSKSNSSLQKFKSLIDKNQLLKKITRKLMIVFSNIFKKEFDIYWEPNFIPLDSIKAKKVITSVHDFSFVLYKDYHPKERIEYFEKNFFKNIYRSNYIICFSEFTKKEILNYIDIDENRVKVIYHGVDHKLFKVYKDKGLNFELPESFIFCAGSIEPRKNLLGLLKAYNNLDKNLKNKYKLVLAGFKGWNNSDVLELIEKNRDNIIYLGYITDEELAKVYNLATIFVYPSFYEGFGLPVLEAMACGTAVITSNISSLPEVGGDAVIYCNPYDVGDICNKIKMLLTDENLQRELKIKGVKRAKQFTWEKSAKEHIELFKWVMNE